MLAACSPFFREVLRRNPHQHPLLYLKGVKYKEQGLTQENLNSDNKAKSFKSKPNISSETGGCLAFSPNSCNCFIIGLVYELMKYFTLVMSHKNIYKNHPPSCPTGSLVRAKVITLYSNIFPTRLVTSNLFSTLGIL